MSPEAQRIAIAEACGWEDLHMTPARFPIEGHSNLFLEGTPPRDKTIWNLSVPNYLSDLDAMHEAEMSLPADSDDGIDRHSFRTALRAICLNSGNDAMHAIAAQRAVAFLHTIGKWDDAK